MCVCVYVFLGQGREGGENWSRVSLETGRRKEEGETDMDMHLVTHTYKEQKRKKGKQGREG